MSGTDYTYDEKGQFFPYFVLTVTALFTVPISYSALKPSKELQNTGTPLESDFKAAESDYVEKQRSKEKRKERRLKRGIAAVLGWAVMAWMVYLMIVTARTVPKIWDPYEILGISRSATEKQIKSHYRKLSLLLHPDKYRPDPAKNETVESISNHWVEVTKAFKTLTDEEIRNNYIQYGHPDGKQSFSIGIALPQFIVTEGNGKYVLLLYAILLGVFLPWLVGTWWYGSQKMTKEKILVTSAGKLFAEYREEMNEGAIISALSSGEEYEDALQDKKGSGTSTAVEKAILTEDASADSQLKLAEDDITKLQNMDDEQRRLALSLLWAYLGRVKLGSDSLTEQKYAVAPIARSLNEAFLTMAPTFANIQPVLSSYRVQQEIIQAVPPRGSPLLQLPHFNTRVVRAIEAETLRKNKQLQTYMNLPDAKRRKLVVGPGLLNEAQYKSAMKVASQLPYARVETAFFKVPGERFITPSSLISFVVKIRIIPPGVSKIPEVNLKDLEDIDPKEDDLEAIKKKKTGKTGDEDDESGIQPPLAHAPYFPSDYAPRWRVFLAENKSGKIAVPPFTFSTFDKPLFKDDLSPTFNVQTLKMQFQAPPQAGHYPFTMHLVCDSYIGLDSELNVIMKVEEQSKAEEIEEEEEISEPEEETLAGQMSAMKGGQGKKRKVKKPVEEDSDDSSDTEGDESSESDTDTDTSSDEE